MLKTKSINLTKYTHEELNYPARKKIENKMKKKNRIYCIKEKEY